MHFFFSRQQLALATLCQAHIAHKPLLRTPPAQRTQRRATTARAGWRQRGPGHPVPGSPGPRPTTAGRPGATAGLSRHRRPQPGRQGTGPSATSTRPPRAYPPPPCPPQTLFSHNTPLPSIHRVHSTLHSCAHPQPQALQWQVTVTCAKWCDRLPGTHCVRSPSPAHTGSSPLLRRGSP